MSTQTTVTSAKAWSPDVQGIPAEEAIPDALALSITNISGAVQGDDVAVRVPYVTDDEAHIVPEGQEIPEADPELSEAIVITTKVAKLLRLSREQFFQDRAAGILSNAAQRSIIAKADAVLLNQLAPTAPAITPPAGILAQGITNAGIVANNLDTLIDAVATIGEAGGTPSHIVLSPTAWASIQKFKSATGSAAALLGSGTEATVPMLLGLPVLVSRAVPSGSGLIVDRSDIVSAIGDVLVTQSDEVYFTSDSIGLRVTFRFGATVVHPNRHAKFTVTSPAP